LRLGKKTVNEKNMIIIPVKEGENIERALKRFKRKFEKTGVIKELRERQAFSKPSVKKRTVMKKAVYIQGLQRQED
jgi:small subunit ribosomal protein S21